MIINSVEEGVKRLFELKKEDFIPFTLVRGKRYKEIKLEGKSIPLFVSRYYPKWARIKGLNVLGSPCAITGYFVSCSSLEEIMFREFDLCEWWLESEISRLTVYRNGDSANVLLSFKIDTTANLQLHSAKCGSPQFKHELFTTGGMASDRAVDTLIAQGALNVYTCEGHEQYTDVDINLYGLDEWQINEVYCIYNTLKESSDELRARAERLNRIVDLAMKGERTYYAMEDF